MTDAIARVLFELIRAAWAAATSNASEADKLARLERAAMALTAEQASDALADRLLRGG